MKTRLVGRSWNRGPGPPHGLSLFSAGNYAFVHKNTNLLFDWKAYDFLVTNKKNKNTIHREVLGWRARASPRICFCFLRQSLAFYQNTSNSLWNKSFYIKQQALPWEIMYFFMRSMWFSTEQKPICGEVFGWRARTSPQIVRFCFFCFLTLNRQLLIQTKSKLCFNERCLVS